MEKKHEAVQQIAHDYYSDHEFVLIGMNDYANNSIFFKNILGYIADEINQSVLSIDAASLTLNKAEHINIMLENNLSIEEIKIAKLLSVYDGICNLFMERSLEGKKEKVDQFLSSKLDTLIKKTVEPNDKYLNISTIMEQTQAPIIIHSTGANNLMRTLGTNPYTLKKDYENRELNSNYYYALMRAECPNTIKEVINKVERNFDTILAINPNSIIFSLGLYVQKILKEERFKEFKNLILEYNACLKDLCDKYKVHYIETMQFGNSYENGVVDFNLSKKAQQEIAKTIAEELVNYLHSVNYDVERKAEWSKMHYTNKDKIVPNIQKEIIKKCNESTIQEGREKEITLHITDELAREAKIYADTFELVKKRNRKNR